MTQDSDWLLWALALALSLALLGVTFYLSRTEATTMDQKSGGRGRVRGGSERTGRAPRSAFGGGEPAQQRVAIIVNPTKFDDPSSVRSTLTEVCRAAGWADPLWLETTAQDPGTGQTQEAVAAGVDLVCPLGGDGTVRTVGAALAGTGMPMGLLPAGTGNLLARNLRLPIDSIPRALEVALTGRNAPIDTCTLTLTRPTTAQLAARVADEDDPSQAVAAGDAVGQVDEETGLTTPESEEHVFLVMAGVGFDAEVMAGVPERLKASMGWAAYLVSAAQHLKGPQFVVDLRLEDGTRVQRRSRGLIVGNVGKLQGGVELLPEAKSDDGVVDAVLLSPQGVVGWGAVLTRVLSKQRKGHPRVEHFSSARVQVQLDKPIELQIDGDTLGTATAMDVVVAAGSLVVRMPN